MQWDPHDVVDDKVVSVSEWWINLKEHETLEPRAGVYLFSNSKLDIKYIGHAGAGQMVQEVTNAMKKKKSKGASQVRALYTNSHQKAESLEKLLIQKYDPVNNRK
jgi:excinuclease UvrABC nuclease subunit